MVEKKSAREGGRTRVQRKIIPDAENRLLILYALKTVGAMTDQQLLIVMTDTDLMNYITLQLTIADLESEGKLRRQGDTSGGTLELTDAGRYLLNSFEMHIPVSRRGLIDSGAAQWRERFAAEQMAAVEIFDLPNGEKGLHLRIVDRRNVLLDITFALPTGKRINCLQQRWQQCMNQGLPAPAVHLGQRPHAGKEAAGRVQRAAGERLGVADDRLRQPDAADHYADGEPADRGNGA